VPVEAVAPQLGVAVGDVQRPQGEPREEPAVAEDGEQQQHRPDHGVPAELAPEVAHRPRLPPRQLVGGGGEQVDVAGVGRVGRRPGDAARPAVQLLGQPAPVAAPGDGDAERAEPPAAFGRGGGRRGRRRERRAAGPGRQRGGARPRPRRLRGVVRARGDRALAEEHGLELVGAGEARGRVLLEHAHHRRRQVGRAVGAPLVDGDRPLGEVLDEHGRRARRLERQHAGEHLVRHHAQRVEVGAAVDLAVAGALLGAHVRRRADGHPGGREARVAPLDHRPRDAEVGDHGAVAVVVEEDVVGLDVAVHHAARVGVGERVGHLGEHAPHVVHRHRAAVVEALAEVLAVDARHHEEHQPVGLVDRVDRDDVRVRELRGRLGLAQEARADLGAVGELGRQHLDRHLALEAAVARPVDHAHAAAPHLGPELVRARHGAADARGQLRVGARGGRPGSRRAGRRVAGGARGCVGGGCGIGHGRKAARRGGTRTV
jgi:hypothetical protein